MQMTDDILIVCNERKRASLSREFNDKNLPNTSCLMHMMIYKRIYLYPFSANHISSTPTSDCTNHCTNSHYGSKDWKLQMTTKFQIVGVQPHNNINTMWCINLLLKYLRRGHSKFLHYSLLCRRRVSNLQNQKNSVTTIIGNAVACIYRKWDLD